MSNAKVGSHREGLDCRRIAIDEHGASTRATARLAGAIKRSVGVGTAKARTRPTAMSLISATNWQLPRACPTLASQIDGGHRARHRSRHQRAGDSAALKNRTTTGGAQQ